MLESHEFELLRCIGNVISFCAYLGLFTLLLAAFFYSYTKFTPLDEWSLIKQNNEAAAIAFSGATLGFVIALTTAFKVSISIVDFVLWGSLAILVQCLTFQAVHLTIPNLTADLKQGYKAKAIFLACTSLSTGLMNAAALFY
ncbi:hypothetical protein BS333_15800 [Vibrio azureus]|uniref:DUF350 domain-containing protein n=1 Tax=Vibrio azureus NBRC 104587 TaxID=1219077 RepID=U3CD31_9VIBR|nr:DUF350 domain-containing protein [Vibrio azureus]AUI87857.1 hypothetical protein BS333_15800 [Vibrio azureus]GAD76248.1 hypothetical protein VAZ01S_040_00020 [Vibrio azureus NBRC 104587]